MDKEIKEVIMEILEKAVDAPSGHNSQPWRFVVKGDAIFTWNVPEKDKTLFNYKQRGSLIAHGALIENIIILASEKGYGANVILCPRTEEPDLTARINLEKSNSAYAYQHLAPFISERATNRKPYRKIPLGASEQKKLAEFSEVVLLQEEKAIVRAAKALSMADKLLFDNFYLHQALFNNVNWTLKKEREKREGLYVGTKELSFLERAIFRCLLSNWSIFSKLNKIGASEKAAQKRQRLYGQCSAIGLLAATNDSPESFIKSGRVLQQFWLTATSLGLSFHPISVGLLYLGQQLQKELPSELTPEQAELVKNAYKDIIGVFNVSNMTPVFSFRIGYSNKPSFKSLKREPEITYHES